MKKKLSLLGAVATVVLAVPLGAVPALAVDGVGPAAESAGSPVRGDRAEDGRAIAEGILFLSGRYGDRLAALPSFAAAAQLRDLNRDPESRTMTAELLDAIALAHPHLFGDLHDSVRSGDPYRVERALQQLSDAGRQALTERAAHHDGDGVLDDRATADGLCVVLTFAVGGNIAVAVNAAVGANIAWTINWVWKAGTEDRRQLVADMTALLSS